MQHTDIQYKTQKGALGVDGAYRQKDCPASEIPDILNMQLQGYTLNSISFDAENNTLYDVTVYNPLYASQINLIIGNALEYNTQIMHRS